MSLPRDGAEAVLSFFYHVEGGKFMAGRCRCGFIRGHFRHSDFARVATRAVPPLFTLLTVVLVAGSVLVCTSLACTAVLFLVLAPGFVRASIFFAFVFKQVVEEFIARRL